MSTAAVAVALLFGFVFTFLPFIFKAGYQGRLRRGAGWYLDVSTPSEGPLPAYRRAPRSELTRPALIRLYAVAGAGDLALALVAWLVLDAPVVAIIVAVVGLVLLGMSAEGWRTNRVLQSESPDLASELLGKAAAARQDAEALRFRGDTDGARLLLEETATELRQRAPGSGRPDEVMERVRGLLADVDRL